MLRISLFAKVVYIFCYKQTGLINGISAVYHAIAVYWYVLHS